MKNSFQIPATYLSSEPYPLLVCFWIAPAPLLHFREQVRSRAVAAAGLAITEVCRSDYQQRLWIGAGSGNSYLFGRHLDGLISRCCDNAEELYLSYRLWKELGITGLEIIDKEDYMGLIDKIELFKVAPRWLFLKMTTSDGLEGWGEPIVEGKADTVAAAVREFNWE